MSETTKWLMQAAEEIRKEGHAGWGNTCEQAAERMTELEEQLAELREAAAKVFLREEPIDSLAVLLKQEVK